MKYIAIMAIGGATLALVSPVFASGSMGGGFDHTGRGLIKAQGMSRSAPVPHLSDQQ
jgi:hypothetical protein